MVQGEFNLKIDRKNQRTYSRKLNN